MSSSLHGCIMTQLAALQSVPMIYFNPTHVYEAPVLGWAHVTDLVAGLWAPVVQKGRHTYMQSPDSMQAVMHRT